MRAMTFLSVAILASSLTLVLGLDEKIVREQACIPPPANGANLDLKWFREFQQFYITLWSRSYAYRIASDLLEREGADISENELINSCTVLQSNYHVLGYNREVEFNVTNDGESLVFRAPWIGAKTGNFTVHLTDNANYVLGVTCWENNQSSWAVFTTTPLLDASTKQMFVDYIKSIGFKEKFAVEPPCWRTIVGLDETEVLEKKCSAVPKPKEDVFVDSAWMTSVSQFYVPYWSKLYAYRIASDLLDKDPADVIELAFGTSCVLMKPGNIVTGFNREVQYKITGDGKSLTFKGPSTRSKSAKFAYHLTDNSTYILGVTCWEDDESSWAVLSTTPKLSSEIQSHIHDYVTSLGFKQKFAATAPCGEGIRQLDENEVKEKKCSGIPPKEPVSIDGKWMSSVTQFYVPYWSKLYAYRIASDILEKDVAAISDYELGTACVIMKGTNVTGFNREVQFNITGDGNSLAFQAPWAKGNAARFTFHLTDNKTFILGVTCWLDDKESSWAVLSTTPTLESGVKEQILNYVTGLGFKERFAAVATCLI